jgi:hypothetical protein
VPRQVNDRPDENDQGGQKHARAQQVANEIFDLTVIPDWQDNTFHILPAMPL